ncbi:MAG: CBS domain-containing protein, partial [Candidatus Acidiferrum sp.]
MSGATLEVAHLVLTAETAADLMSSDPVSIREDACLREAVLLLHDRHFGAAPVIDDAGRAVGVISRADVLTHERETVNYALPRKEYYDPRDLQFNNGERLPNAFQVETVETTAVRDLMTPAVFGVRPTTPVAEVVEQMVALHVHRLFVVDETGVLV